MTHPATPHIEPEVFAARTRMAEQPAKPIADAFTATLQSIEQENGMAEVLAHAGGLLFGAILNLADLVPLAAVIDILRTAAAEFEAKGGEPAMPVDQIPRPNPVSLAMVSHQVSRAARKLRAQQGTDAAFVHALAAMQASCACLHRIAGTETLAILLRSYADRADTFAEIVEAGEIPPGETMQ